MATTSARLLGLLGLLQTPRDWTGEQLAQRLGVTTRTVRKDVQRLRDLGYPVASVPGVGGGYRLRPGAQLPPLLLDDDEAVAVALGLQSAAVGSIAGIEETALVALTKIAQLLPSRLRQRVEVLGQASAVLTAPGPVVEAGLLQSLATACRAREGVRFDYRGSDGASSRRQVEPYQLVHRRGRWYLVGYDLDREDWRTFRVDRLVLRVPGGARFRPRPVPGGDPAALLEQRVGDLARSRRATVRLPTPVAELAQWWQPSWGELEAGEEGPGAQPHCLLHLASDSWEMIAANLASSGLEFEVVGPAELVDEVRAMAGRLSRAVPPGPAGQQQDEPGRG